ncbi:MAG: dTDP-4-dehydrorhamnose reductase [Bacteroidales bacterium]|nr:dTDP-4-dehydrorhamnose reductase [Bacteroidales bacterium]
MISILITGSKGQLGSEFQKLAADYPDFRFVFTDIEELDLIDFKAVDSYISKNSFHYCINCAGYTSVDQAEDEPGKAFLLNADAVGNLAKVCEKNQVRFIHISTDYVFNGKANKPYKEDDPVSPQSVYGFSKLRGEEVILKYTKDAIIIRTAWLCSAYGKNFVKTMLKLGLEKQELKVVNDQIGSPTFTEDFSKAILEIIRNPLAQKSSEIYHYSSLGIISWFDFAKEIMHQAGLNCRILPVNTLEYPTKAKRPAYSVLDKSKIIKDYKLEIPEWQDSLLKLIQDIKH